MGGGLRRGSKAAVRAEVCGSLEEGVLLEASSVGEVVDNRAPALMGVGMIGVAVLVEAARGGFELSEIGVDGVAVDL